MRRQSAVGLRPRLSEIMEPYAGGPNATSMSFVVDIFVLVCIIGSCILVVLEWSQPEMAYRPAEVFFTLVFVIEYLLRWYSSENRWLYPFSAMAILDFLAILPGLLLLGPDLMMLRAVRGVRMLRLLRLLRLVRLLRLMRYGPLIFKSFVQARVWFSSIVYQYRLGELGKLVLGSAVALFVGANVIHLVEVGLDDLHGPFDGYLQSYWNTLIVLVSGIEDKEPLTFSGRLTVMMLLITGLVIVGMLTAEIVAILVRRSQRIGKVAIKPPKSHFIGHIVILGRNHHVDAIVRQVNSALSGHHILIVDPEAEDLPVSDPRLYRRVFALNGDPLHTRVLEQADIEDAARIIVLAPEVEHGSGEQADNQTLMVMVAATGRQRSIPMVVELLDEQSLRYTGSLTGIDVLVGRQFAERLASQAVLNSGVTEVYDELLTFTVDSNEIYTVSVPEQLLGKTFADAQLYFLDHRDLDITLIGIDRSPDDRPSSCFYLCPQAGESGISDEEICLTKTDQLIVLAYEQPIFCTVRDPWASSNLARA